MELKDKTLYVLNADIKLASYLRNATHFENVYCMKGTPNKYGERIFIEPGFPVEMLYLIDLEEANAKLEIATDFPPKIEKLFKKKVEACEKMDKISQLIKELESKQNYLREQSGKVWSDDMSKALNLLTKDEVKTILIKSFDINDEWEVSVDTNYICVDYEKTVDRFNRILGGNRDAYYGDLRIPDTPAAKKEIQRLIKKSHVEISTIKNRDIVKVEEDISIGDKEYIYYKCRYVIDTGNMDRYNKDNVKALIKELKHKNKVPKLEQEEEFELEGNDISL